MGLLSRIKKAMTCEYWAIAYSEAGEVIDKIISEKYVSLADPFLFYHRGCNWLFCERQDLTDMKGSLWCINLDEEGSEPVCVLEEPFHLSYPQVFEYANQIYMIPESRQAGEVRLYRCTNFPDRWVCEDVIFPFPAVDTTIYIKGRNIDRTLSRQERLESVQDTDKQQDALVFTYVDKHLEIYRLVLEGNRFEIRESELLFKGDRNETVRPAGRLISTEDGVVRPAQYCTSFYGEKVLLYKLGGETEELMSEMTPEDFSYLPLNVKGVHTYNENENYQVVDILHEEIGIGVLFKKIYWTWYNKRHRDGK